MQVVILSGGYGTRLSEETKVVPKAFVKIGWSVTIRAAIPVGIPFEIE